MSRAQRIEQVERALLAAVPEVAQQAHAGATLFWAKARAVTRAVGCPRCGRAATQKCRNLRTGADLSPVHDERLNHPIGAAVVEAIEAMYVALRSH